VVTGNWCRREAEKATRRILYKAKQRKATKIKEIWKGTPHPALPTCNQ
jgi:hypothetical protein